MQVNMDLSSGQPTGSLSPRDPHPLADDKRAGTGGPAVIFGGDCPEVALFLLFIGFGTLVHPSILSTNPSSSN